MARIGAATALTAVVVVLLLADALSPEYAMDPVVLVTLVGAIGGLLGAPLVANFLRHG